MAINFYEVNVEVEVNGKVYGTINFCRPFVAFRRSTSTYMGHGTMKWEIEGENLSAPDKRIIARVINKKLAENKHNIELSKRWKHRRSGTQHYRSVTLVGVK